jgi:hypothetical protein
MFGNNFDDITAIGDLFYRVLLKENVHDNVDSRKNEASGV